MNTHRNIPVLPSERTAVQKNIEFCVIERANEKQDTEVEKALEQRERLSEGQQKISGEPGSPRQEQEKDKQEAGERERWSPWRGATLCCHTAETSFLSLLAC